MTACWIRSRSKAVCTRPADQQFSREDQWLGAAALRLPQCRGGEDGRLLPCRRGHPPSNREKEPRRSHPQGGGLRTLFHRSPARRIHRLRRGGALRGLVAPLNQYSAMKTNSRDPDRWCSHSPAGQEAWQTVSQWVWNLRLELGHQLSPT